MIFCDRCQKYVNAIKKLSATICSECRIVLIDTSPWIRMPINQQENYD